jgi:hypothetical protein
MQCYTIHTINIYRLDSRTLVSRADADTATQSLNIVAHMFLLFDGYARRNYSSLLSLLLQAQVELDHSYRRGLTSFHLNSTKVDRVT